MLIMQQDSMHKEHYSLDAVGKVIKCSLGPTKTNQIMWRCYINFDYEYRKDKQVKERCMNLVAYEPLSKCLKVWNRGDLLAVKGKIEKKAYNGKEYYQVIAAFVVEQPDYSAAESISSDGDDASSEGGYTSSDFDPGF